MKIFEAGGFLGCFAYQECSKVLGIGFGWKQSI
jgi:hypothetical protein